MGLTGSTLDQLDQIGDWGLLATDADLVVTRWNRWLEQRSGLSAADVIGRPLLSIFPDLVDRRMDRYYRQALTGQTVLLSQRLHRYVIPLSPTLDETGLDHLQQTSRIVPLIEEGTVVGTLTLVEDVTERVAYEAELRARFRQQAAMAAAARSALGGRGTIDLAREVVGHLCDTLDVDFIEVLELSPDGRSGHRIAGAGWAEESDVAAASSPRVQFVLNADGMGAKNLSQHVLDDDAVLRAHRVTDGLVASIPAQDRPFGLLGVYTCTSRRFPPGEHLFIQALADVLGVAAERKRLEAELHERVRDLAEADRRKDEFLAMLAHELRNPLAPVRNGLQVLRLICTADPEMNRLTEMMSRQVGQVARLVDDLLDVSRITQGKVALRMEQVDLNLVVKQAVEAARSLILARKHELTVAAPPAPIGLNADPSRLAQVIGNLLNNAIKYTDEGGRILLEIRREGDEAVLRVRDTGVGISAEMLPRVFDLFTQVDPTLDRSQGGLGVGLTLVRSLVHLHGGTVRVESPGHGQGSEFVVRLPALPQDSQSFDRQSVHESAHAPFPSRRILIVDDNVDAAESLAILLRLSGHQVRTAFRGQVALDTVENDHPELVLLDIGLPDMDGYEVCRRLRRNPLLAGIKVVALTGYGQEEDRRKTNEAGFDHHLLKPVDLNDLRKLLEEMST